jgi:hypothetical protein
MNNTATQNTEVISTKMLNFLKPIDRQIMMCDNQEDLMALAIVYLSTAKRIFDLQLGNKNRIILMKEITDNE